MTGQVQNVAEIEPQESVDVNASEAPTEVQTVEEQPEVKDTGNREAAKYRRQLRDTEAELDTLKQQHESEVTQLKQQLTGARAATLEHLKQSRQIQTGAISEVFPDPNTLFNDDGTLNQQKYDEAYQHARTNRPYLFMQKLIIPSEGQFVDTSNEGRGDFSEAFAPK